MTFEEWYSGKYSEPEPHRVWAMALREAWTAATAAERERSANKAELKAAGLRAAGAAFESRAAVADEIAEDIRCPLGPIVAIRQAT